MPYSSPAAPVSGAVISKTTFGDVVKADLDFLANPPSCRAYHNAAQSHTTSGNWQTVLFNTEVWDTDNMHSTSVNTSRITINTAGLYIVTASVAFLASATGTRGIRLNVNGVPSATLGCRALWQPNAGVESAGVVSTIMKLAVTNYVEVNAYQSSGAALNMTSVEGDPHFAATWIGLG